MSESMVERVDSPALIAIAEAWASIDGKLDEFRGAMCSPEVDARTAHFSGRMEDARELLARTQKRGFALVPLEPTDAMLAAEITDEHRVPRVYQWSELEEPNVLRRARQHLWHAMVDEALKPD